MINKKNVAPIILFLSFLLVFVSCQKKEAEWKGTIEEDEDGYQYVKRYRMNWISK
jgi:hypothetical protein